MSSHEPPPEPPSGETLAERARRCFVGTYRQPPITFTRGEGARLFDSGEGQLRLVGAGTCQQTHQQRGGQNSSRTSA